MLIYQDFFHTQFSNYSSPKLIYKFLMIGFALKFNSIFTHFPWNLAFTKVSCCPQSILSFSVSIV